MQPNRSKKRVIFTLLGFLGFYVGICYVLANNYVHPARRISVIQHGMVEILVPTRYGDTPSWATPSLQGHPSKVIFLLAHGYGGNRASWAEAMLALKDRGFDSVALSMPGQDASPASKVGFGLSEAHVVVDGVKWLRKTHPGHPVVVLGVSMGGAAAWLATKEDPTIDGIITDAAFARFDEPMDAFFNRRMPGGSFFFQPVVWIAERMAGVDPSAIRPVDAAPLWRGKPALVIQGDADTLVAPSHGTRLSEASGCPIWMVHGAEHAESFQVDREGYLDHLQKFANQFEAISSTKH